MERGAAERRSDTSTIGIIHIPGLVASLPNSLLLGEGGCFVFFGVVGVEAADGGCGVHGGAEGGVGG